MAWNFLTNHALVLMYIGKQPECTGLQIAQPIGITERAARKIVADLEGAGYVQREKIGRRNRYHVDASLPLRHPAERAVTVGELLELLWHDHQNHASRGRVPSANGETLRDPARTIQREVTASE